MSKARDLVLMFVALFLFWVLLNGSLASDVLIVGVLAAAVISFVFRSGLGVFSELRLTPRALLATVLYFGFFAKELVKANLSLARVVLAPALPIHPGIVKVKTRLKSPMGRLMLANSITLTPGTLTVEMQGEWLYIHWVNVDSTETEVATSAILGGFERYLEVMYG